VLRVLQILRKPAEAIAVADVLHDAAHVHLQGANVGIGHLRRLARQRPVQAHLCHELTLRARAAGHINLVAQDEERGFGELLRLQQHVQLLFRLWETHGRGRIDNEHDTVDLREIVFPQAARLLMTTHVDGLQLNATEREVLGVGVESGAMDVDLIRGQLTQQRRFTSIVEAKEEQLTGLVGQAQVGQPVPNPAKPAHDVVKGSQVYICICLCLGYRGCK
jgi:hypothetical protein